LPEGLEPLGAVEIARATPSIDRSTTAHLYEVDLGALDTPPAPADVAGAVARFLASPTLPVRKHSRHGERTGDGRRMVRDLAQPGPQTLAIELAVGPDGTLKPGVVVGTLLELPDAVVPLLRVHKRATRLDDGGARAAGVA